MDNTRLMKIVGYLILGAYAAGNLLFIFRTEAFDFGPQFGAYSIYSSEKFFIAYHVWGILLSGVMAYAMWKEIRILFMTSLMLLLIVMFYPYFTSSPADRQKAAQENPELIDSLNNRKAPSVESMDSMGVE